MFFSFSVSFSFFFFLFFFWSSFFFVSYSRIYEETTIDENLKQYDQGKHRVCLYHEWETPVERIETLEAFHTLIPSRQQSSSTNNNNNNNNNNNKDTENNILLALYEDSCERDTHHHFFIGAQYESGPGVVHLAAVNKKIIPNIEKDWDLPNNCTHFIFIPKHSNYEDFESFRRLSNADGPDFVRFLSENRHVDVKFINNVGKPLDLYWYDDDDMIHLGTIEAEQTYRTSTLLGHAFVVIDPEDDFLVDYYVIESAGDIDIVEPTLCKERGIEDRSVCNSTMRHEMWDWIYEFWARKREILNFIQPKIVRNFTKVGFAQTRLDDELFKKLTDFWKNAREHDNLLEEGEAGPVMNQQKSPTFMAYLGDSEREALTDWIKPKLEQWANVTELHLTSLYGIRMYTRGAILGMHVDTCSTHVISAIINVDRKVDEGKDWPLQIYDHNGQLHEFTMVPGDVVFYESAKSGHARFKPLPGEYYANIFIHFKPTDENLWNYDWF